MVLIMIALNLNYAVFGVAPNDIGESIILYLSFLFAALSLLRFAFVYPRLKPRPRIVISAIYIIFIACAVLTNLFFDFSRSSFFLDNLDFFVFFGGVIYFVSLDEFYLEKC
ncbi:hypothetical protein M2319_000102 [Rhodobium gokarnense]|uniref:Uncharacterized protein n=1 Tax=Rhodobium gokarnense TaxID=364296 RepID=A0ABT3H5Z0_9HYPH|nr:hypothetical protein [Rhodobium gokarnense]